MVPSNIVVSLYHKGAQLWSCQILQLAFAKMIKVTELSDIAVSLYRKGKYYSHC